MTGFSNSVRAFIRKSERMIEGVAKQSIADVVEDAQTVRALGGRMRVDTGFLRASGGAALGSMPSGPTSGAGNVSGESLSGQPLVVVLASWNLDVPVFWGWSASYARAREAHDGFMALAVQKWPAVVKRNVAKAKRGLVR